VITKAETIGMGMLSSIGLYASVSAPANAPITAICGGKKIIVHKSPTTKKARVPSTDLNFFKGNLCFPYFFPTSVEAESPIKSIKMAAYAIEMLKLKIKSVAIIPKKKYKNPLSSSDLLQMDKIVEIRGTLMYLSTTNTISIKTTIITQRSINTSVLRNKPKISINIPDA